MKKAAVCIIGNGAIGSLVAAKSVLAGFDISCAIRNHNAPVSRVILADGVSVTLPKQSNPADLAKIDFSLIIVPLKVYQLAEAIKQWRALFRSDIPVVLLHNGMGGEAIFRRIAPDSRLYQATTSHGALKHATGFVSHTGNGASLAGRASATLQDNKRDIKVQNLLSAILPPLTWCEDMQTALWQKLSVNLAINPLTALYNIPNGDLLEERFTVPLRQICDETALVMRANGIDETSNMIYQRVRQVAAATAANYSSMHQDVIHQRPTEISAITGYLLQEARKHGIETPHNQRLYDDIVRLHP